MSGTVDDFVKGIQEQMDMETKEAYGAKASERWTNPFNQGILVDPDGFARVSGRCGDTMEIYLKFENDRVKEASFQTDGCGSSMVCGSFAAEMALGKNPDEIMEITGDAILEKFGSFPKEDEHCAFLAQETLHEALNDFMTK